nr:hypothetical protein [Bradyrhizobium centrolobii]
MESRLCQQAKLVDERAKMIAARGLLLARHAFRDQALEDAMCGRTLESGLARNVGHAGAGLAASRQRAKHGGGAPNALSAAGFAGICRRHQIESTIWI